MTYRINTNKSIRPSPYKRFPSQDLVLSPKRQLNQQPLQRTKHLKKARKHKRKIRAQNLKPSRLQKPARLPRRQGNRVLIKDATRHHIPCARIPPEIFPQPKNPAGTQRAMNIPSRRKPLLQRNVMEHSVAVSKIEGAIGPVLIHQKKTAPLRTFFRARKFDRARRHIHSDGLRQPKSLREQRRGCAHAAPVIKRPARRESKIAQAPFKPRDAAFGIEHPIFTGKLQRRSQTRVVVVSVSIESRLIAHIQ